MGKVLLILLVIVLVGGGFWYFSNMQNQAPMNTTEETMMENQVTITIGEQNDSGEMGTATFVEENGEVVVTLKMTGFEKGVPQPAHIHTGSCPNVGSVVHGLTNVVDGMSTTTLKTTLAQLKGQMPLGLNVHKSVPQSSVYVSCGDLQF